MKSLLTLFLILTLALLTTGCGETRAENPAAVEPAPAATYKEGHGLQLTLAARTFIGLTTAEVLTRDFADAKGATAVPAEALLRTVKGDFIFVSNGEWFLRTPVTCGVSDATHVAINDGLYEGDRIVVQGVRELWLAEIQAVNGGVGCADGH
jgi:hypothetical protein